MCRGFTIIELLLYIPLQKCPWCQTVEVPKSVICRFPSGVSIVYLIEYLLLTSIYRVFQFSQPSASEMAFSARQGDRDEFRLRNSIEDWRVMYLKKIYKIKYWYIRRNNSLIRCTRRQSRGLFVTQVCFYTLYILTWIRPGRLLAAGYLVTQCVAMVVF